MRTLVWFRGKDLRVTDHAPLVDALKQGEIVCVFVVDPYFFEPERAQKLPHRMQFLLESLEALQKNIAHLGGELLLVRGKSIDVIPEITRAWKIERVVAQGWTEPFARERDERIKGALRVPFDLFGGETLAAPETVRTQDGRAFSVFTPFARAHRLATAITAPLAAPKTLPPLPRDISVSREKIPTLSELGVSHNPNILRGGERAARERLKSFLMERAARYDTERDRMDLDHTSKLSADLKFGVLSPRAVWTAAREALETAHPNAWKIYSNELLWREFAHMVLWENPGLLKTPHRSEFTQFSWDENESGWRAWCEGKTGFPIIDASARELLQSGFVHNRARMISASFLTKDLLIDYRRGEAHYMRYLTDGDWAQNNAGWQWATGCGFDAAPYFRVFNPVDQAKRFDVTGAYVRKWLPELAALPDKYLHDPWNAPPLVLRAANVVLGETYPRPIVDHADARKRYLLSMSALKKAKP